MLATRTLVLLCLLFCSPIASARVLGRKYAPEQSPATSCSSNAECLHFGLPLLPPQPARDLSRRQDANPLTNRTYTCGQDFEIPITANVAGFYNYVVAGAPGGGTTEANPAFFGGLAAFVVGQVEFTQSMGSVFLRLGCIGNDGPLAGGGGGASAIYTVNRQTGTSIIHAVAAGGGGAGQTARGVDPDVIRNAATPDSGGIGGVAPGLNGGAAGTSTTGDAGGGGGGVNQAGGGVRGASSGQGGQAIGIASSGAGGLGASVQTPPQGAGAFGGGGGAGRTTGGGGGGYAGGAGGSSPTPTTSNGGGAGSSFPLTAMPAVVTTGRRPGYVFLQKIR